MTTIVVTFLFPLLSLQAVQVQGDKSPLQVTGPKVIFFSPSQTERDSLVRSEGLEIARQFDDFDYYAGKASAFLKGRRIPVLLTSSSSVQVKLGDGALRLFERKSIPEFFGVILTDGVQIPRIIPGVVTEEELITEFRQFFRLK